MLKQEHLAIASVPIQQWGNLCEQGEALAVGTIFRELNLPFFAAEKETDRIPASCPSQRPGKPEEHDREALNLEGEGRQKKSGSDQDVTGKMPEQQERECMMLQIMEISFMLDDIRLYMDTHNQDTNGLKLLKQTVGKRMELLKEFASQYYPLTQDCMADIYEQFPETDCYCWEKGPMPWEGVCI